jgi:hypothetical protein
MGLPTFILAVVSVFFFCSATYAIVGNETDRHALLQFKAKIISDPFMVFSSWNDTIHPASGMASHVIAATKGPRSCAFHLRNSWGLYLLPLEI